MKKGGSAPLVRGNQPVPHEVVDCVRADREQTLRELDEGSAEGLPQILWRRRWTIMGMVVVGLAGAVGYLLAATPLYHAEAKLCIDAIGPGMLGLSGADTRLPENHLRTQCELICSRPVLEEAVRACNGSGMRSLASRDDPVEYLTGRISAQAGRRDDIVTLSLTLPEPHEARALVAGVIDAYINQHTKEERSSTGRLIEILRKERVQREAEWTGKQREMMEFQRANGELSFQGEKGNVILERLSRLSEALTAAQQRRVEAQSACMAAQETLSSPDGARKLTDAVMTQGTSASSDPEYNELIRQLNSLRLSRAAMEKQAMSAHPMARSSQEMTASLVMQIHEKQQRFAEAYVAMLRQHAEAAKQMEAQLQTMFDEQKQQALELNSKSVDRTRLTAELSRIERATDLVETRIKDLGTVAQAGAVNIRVVEAAHVSKSPTSPTRSAALSGGLAAGLLLGVVVALLRDWRDESFHTPDAVRASIETPMLAVVPHIPGRLDTAACGRLVQSAPFSPAAESYRFIRSAIEAELARGTGNVLLVTSAVGGEGKTTVAANLAIVLAEAGRRVLLIDADLRRPAQDRVFGVACSAGLASVLEGRMPWAEAVQSSGLDAVDVLLCEGGTINPAEALSSTALPAMLGEVALKYDAVIVDSPPVGVVSDALVLAPFCDHTLLVVRAGVSGRHTCEEAFGRFARVGVTPLGVVVNDASVRRSQYGYGYGGGYAPRRKQAMAHTPLGSANGPRSPA